MKTYSGKFGDKVVQVSQAKNLVIFDEATFAIRRGTYSMRPCPYLVLMASETALVTIDGHAFGGNHDGITALYDIYRKKSVALPNTCIESAEHVLKCMRANRHETAPIGNGSGGGSNGEVSRGMRVQFIPDLLAFVEAQKVKLCIAI